MIARLPSNILNRIAHQMLLELPQSDNNWFAKIRNICFQYDIPHPLTLLQEPMSKQTFKSLVKNKIIDFWQAQLRAHAATLTSLKYFKPHYMSLCRPHPMWSVGVDSYSVNKLVTVARMLSGRYRCGSLTCHFSPASSGLCASCGLELENIEHIIIPRCPKLMERKALLLEYARSRLAHSSICTELFEGAIASASEEHSVQFFLDPTAVPSVIVANNDDQLVF